jgi:hypothetical protein
MAHVFDTIDGLNSTGRALATFARQVKAWRLVASRLDDVREGLGAAELSLDAWQQKFDVQPNRPDAYLRVLFGNQGCRRICKALESIDVAANSVRIDVNKIVERALWKSRTGKNTSDDTLRYVDDEVEASLRWIRRNPSRSRRFLYSAISHTDDLELHLEHLYRKLTLLERLSDEYIEKEHPDVLQALRRLPGRRDIPKTSTSRPHTLQHKLLDGLAARKDAELLHRASKGSSIHIGLSVPQIHKRDFAFLLSLNDTMQEVLMHPVKITAVNDSSRVQSTMSTAIPSLLNNTHESCYMLPSVHSSAGFQVSIPPSAILAPLEYKNPFSTLIRERQESLTNQELYPHDQAALACGLASNVFRLIGSPWLNFLDCGNVRCRKNAAGQWTSMLEAVPGDATITDALDDWIVGGMDYQRGVEKELVKSTQMFRIGLVLAEVALQSPIGHIAFDPSTSTVTVLASGTDGMSKVVETAEIAAEVERKTNVFLGNMVWSCLEALHNEDEEDGKQDSQEAVYYEDVLGQAGELEKLTKEWRRGSPAGSIGGSAVGTPRSARSARSGNVYVY